MPLGSSGTSGAIPPESTEEVDNDDDFVVHVRRRTKRFYVGGFLPGITEKKFNYAARRGVTLTKTYTDTNVKIQSSYGLMFNIRQSACCRSILAERGDMSALVIKGPIFE